LPPISTTPFSAPANDAVNSAKAASNLGRDQPKYPTRGVLAQRSMRQLKHRLQEIDLGAGEERHHRAISRTTKHHRSRDEDHFQEFMKRGVTLRVRNFAEGRDALFHRSDPSRREPLLDSSSRTPLKPNAIPLPGE
jgi:hypothetical protein